MPRATRSVRSASLSLSELNELVACARCKAPIRLPAEGECVCDACGGRYRRLWFAWDLRPPVESRSSKLWDTWEQLQANGAVSYQEDPEHNLATGPRDDCREFARFCGLDGLVLDVGCGPQEWPSHFDDHAPGTRFVGVDPLVGERDARYTQVRGLAEYLPFKEGVFDHVVLATTLDHFVDPGLALNEAQRVLAPAGSIDVWLGHKGADAPRPVDSPAWYRGLRRPDGAQDVFHIRRLDADDAAELFAQSGLRVVANEVIPLDEFRTNFFFKLRS